MFVYLLWGGPLLIPVVDAFPVGNCMGLSFTTSFRFPGTPVREGIRHIHTLEHLENVTFGVRDASPFFAIQRVSQPQRYGDHVTTCVQCKVKGYPQTIYIISRPCAPESSTFMCVQDGTQRAVMNLRVGRLPNEVNGHTLTVSCTYLRGQRIYDRDMEPVLRFLRFFEKRMQWQGGGMRPAHANLQWYRRMVLGLSANESPLSCAVVDVYRVPRLVTTL